MLARFPFGLFALLWAQGSFLSAHEVQVRILDPEGAYTIPAWCSIEDPAGRPCFPRPETGERSPTWSRLRPEDRSGSAPEEGIFFTSGVFTIDLRSNRAYRIAVRRGLEWLPLESEFRVTPQDEVVDISLTPWIRMHDRRWYSGDLEAHLTVEETPLALDAAGLNVVCRMIPSPTETLDPDRASREKIHHLGGDRAFSGAGRPFEDFNVLGLERGIPRAETPFTATDLHWMKHAKEAGGFLEVTRPAGEEVPLAAALGLIDCLRLAGPSRTARDETAEVLDRFEAYYRLLNCGFHIPVSGASGAGRRGLAPQETGSAATFVKFSHAFSYGMFLQRLREGVSWAGNGPAISLLVNGRFPGHVFKVPPDAKVKISVGARSPRPIDRLELVRNGKIVASIPGSATEQHVVREFVEPVGDGGWTAARVFEKRRAPGDRLRYAHSSPIYIEVENTFPVEREQADRFAEDLRKKMDAIREDPETADDEKAWILEAHGRGLEALAANSGLLAP